MPTFKPLSAEELIRVRENKDLEQLAPRGNVFRSEKLQRVAQMGFAKEDLAQVSREVQNLMVRDLEDLARRIAGVPVENPRLDALKIEDLQGIEMLFKEQKEAALVGIATRIQAGAPIGAAASVDVSCCCCTPCCCCAAVESNPFAS